MSLKKIIKSSCYIQTNWIQASVRWYQHCSNFKRLRDRVRFYTIKLLYIGRITTQFSVIESTALISFCSYKMRYKDLHHQTRGDLLVAVIKQLSRIFSSKFFNSLITRPCIFLIPIDITCWITTSAHYFTIIWDAKTLCYQRETVLDRGSLTTASNAVLNLAC